MAKIIKAGDHFLVEPAVIDTEPCLIVTSPYDDEQYLLIPLAEARLLIDVLNQAAADLSAELGTGIGRAPGIDPSSTYNDATKPSSLLRDEYGAIRARQDRR